MRAFEWFGAGMFTEMSGKFIRPGKTPSAPFPWTFVRFFSCMCSTVSFKMWTFCINFTAASKVTFMNPSPWFVAGRKKQMWAIGKIPPKKSLHVKFHVRTAHSYTFFSLADNWWLNVRNRVYYRSFLTGCWTGNFSKWIYILTSIYIPLPPKNNGFVFVRPPVVIHLNSWSPSKLAKNWPKVT